MLSLLPLAFAASTAVALTVIVPLAAPDNAPFISPSLVSLSIEQDRWTDWVGTTSRNKFFYNTLDNLKKITGAPPDIRIGANSEDHTKFNEHVVFAETTFPPPTAIVPYPEALNITVGQSYYDTARFLPRGTHVTWGVSFGQNNATEAVTQAKAIMAAFSSPVFYAAGVTLDFLEIGNEPDLYKNNGLRPSNYTSNQYTKEWTVVAEAIADAVQLAKSSTRFLVGSFAGSSSQLTGFSPQAIYSQNILNSGAGALVSTFSEHRYSGSFCTGNGGLLQDLMTKSTIRSNLTVFRTDIAATHARGLDYILGETNSYACHGAPGVSNTAGAALWALDYALFAPQLGMSKVFFHVGVGFKYTLIQPTTLDRSILDATPLPEPLPPHVQPPYYSAIIAAELIGHTGKAQAVELAIDNPRIAGYASFEEGRLVRALFINSKAFLRGATNRTSVHLDLDFGGAEGPTGMKVKRLAIGFADDASGLTWGGQTYETASGRVSGKLDVESKLIADGVDIAETEAVLLCFD